MSNSVIVEPSNSEMEEEQLDKVVYRRRSSIFQSRTVKLVIDEETDKADNCENEESPPSNNCKRQRVENEMGKENFDLQKYIADLKQERKTWQATLKERKSKRRVLSKQKASLEELGQNLDLNVLTESERSFLASRPNYEYIYENHQELSTTALKMSLLNELVNKLNERFMIRMKEKLDKVTQDIIKVSKQQMF